MFPSTACLVQDKIGAKGAWGFDVSAGCSGFVFALQAGVKMVESGAHSKVLVCGADANTRMTDYTDRATCVLFGDGGGAVLMEPARRGRDRLHRLCARDRRIGRRGAESAGRRQPEPVDPRNHRQEDALHPPGRAGGLQVCGAQDGGGHAPSCSSATASTGADLGCFIPHQANKRIITSTADRLGMDRQTRDHQY